MQAGKPTLEEQQKNDKNLVDSMSNDIFPHRLGDEGFRPAIGLALQQFITGQLSRQGERGKCVHDQVDPQHLDGFQGAVL